MTFTPQPGQQVRVVKCSMSSEALHVGEVGTVIDNPEHGGPTVEFADRDLSGPCWASEVAPVWQPGEVVTPEMGEPPVGSVVQEGASSQSGRGYPRLKRLPGGWFDGAGSLFSWERLAEDCGELILVSLPDAQPEGPKPLDMPEPPEGSTVATRAGTRWVRKGAFWWCGESGIGWGTLKNTNPIVVETATPQSQTREVPLSEVRAGDTVTMRVVVESVDERGRVFVPVQGGARHLPNDVLGMVVSVERPQNPLPTTPNSIGTATVRGVPGVRIALDAEGDWCRISNHEAIPVHEIADYQVLVEGEES